MDKKVRELESLLEIITPAPWSYTEAEVESPYNYWVARRILGNKYDSEFIAESRNLMPKLLFERKQLIEEKEKLLSENNIIQKNKRKKEEIAKKIQNKISNCYGIDSIQNERIAEVSKMIREFLL